MPANFPNDVTALIEAFEKAVRDRGMSRDQLVAAKAGIQEALAKGFTAVGQLEVIVANHLAENAVVREVWKRTRRINYPPRPRKQAATTEDAPPDTPVPLTEVPPIPTAHPGATIA